ncbi:histidine phosphatase family protein [Methylocella sp. CPCC 101449]|jgi:phosphohistidine phosphatase|uniref:SixA phosphatase family protein n=1 Tax=Methylocella sp. CPCC 101449 TaxID=2987531 RepID=UPI002890D12D|nr:histidine phosphatase family protein [Methylocella sp. CPCC 101449]MDT2021061.1 histidine phosphatase family protein [Methylocella sp. CPCC 101449]HEV2572491.1 histidine phosphatase family protein [Beijerinckiaceae bacterium]
MLQLILLRHAKTERSSPNGDHGRKLTDRGERDAALIGKHLRERGLVPDLALVSDSERTRQTFDIVTAQFDRTVEQHLDPELYLADSATLLKAVMKTPPPAERVMIIAHNPGMGELAHSLATLSGSPDTIDHFPTAALAVFAFDAPEWIDLNAAKAHLAYFTTPKLLRPDSDDGDD